MNGGLWAAGIVVVGLMALWIAVSIAGEEGRAVPTTDPEPFQIDLGDDEPSALAAAVAACDLAGVEAELEKGGDQFAGGRFRLFEGGTSLDDALGCGPEMAALLATYVVENAGGDPVLQAAVHTRDPRIVAAVLSVGVDIDAVDDAGDSALLAAVTVDDPDLVEQLLAAGADPDLANEAGHTPLFRAVGLGRVELVGPLLDAGASPEVEAVVGRVDLFAALLSQYEGLDDFDEGLTRIAQVFGAEVDERSGLPTTDLGPARPLFLAAARGDAEVVRLLLDAGADPGVPGGLDGRLPADAARVMGHDDVVALLDG